MLQLEQSGDDRKSILKVEQNRWTITLNHKCEFKCKRKMQRCPNNIKIQIQNQNLSPAVHQILTSPP